MGCRKIDSHNQENSLAVPAEASPEATKGVAQDVAQVAVDSVAAAAGPAVTAANGKTELNKETLENNPSSVKRVPVAATFRGWKEVSGWKESDTLTANEELDDLLSTPTSLEDVLPPAAYGDWYHNVAVLFAGGLLSWIFGYFRFSLAPVFFVVVAAALYYRTQIRKYRTVIKENTQREMSVKKIETDYETMDWFNALLDKYWVFLEPYVCQQVADNVNPMIPSLLALVPAFVQAVWIDSITLGSKPFRVESVKTLLETSDDVLVMDWTCSFTPNDSHDLTFKQLKNRVSQYVVVKVKMFGIAIPFVVKNVAFKATVRIRIHMTESFPHVDTINVSLPELPMFDFVTKLLGDTIFNWEVLAFPGLWPFIYEMIQKYAGPLVLPPFSFQLNVEQLLSGDLNAATGILAIKVREAQHLKSFDRTLDNTMDPYVTFGFNNAVSAKTRTIEDTKHAIWNETLYVLVKNLTDPLRMSIYDYNDDRKDGLVGIVDYDLQDLKKNPVQAGVATHFMRNNKPVGDFLFDLKYLPAILPTRLIDGSTEPAPELNTGIVRLEIVEGSFESDPPLTSSVDLLINGKKVTSTSVIKKNNVPKWNVTTRNVITNRARTRVALILKDGNGKQINAIYSSLSEIIDRTVIAKPTIHFPDGFGQLKVQGYWQPVKMKNVSGATAYTDPIGVVKLVINNAKDLRNLETVGTIDPYIRVLLNGFPKARTTAKDSTTNPEWNEALWVPVNSVNQNISVEAMDVESHNDRSLGSFDIKLTDIISRGDNGELSEFIDKESRVNKLVARKFSKGSVTYTLSFFPLSNVLDPDLEEKIQAAAEQKAKEDKEDAELSEKEKKSRQAKIEAAKVLDKFDESVRLAPPITSFSDTEKKRVSLEDLTNSNSGVFVFQLAGGVFSHTNAYLQVYFDADGYAQFTTGKISAKKFEFESIGDAVVKDLGWSEVTFRLVEEADFNRAEDALAEATIPALNLLKSSYKDKFVVKLNDGSEVYLKSRFIPTIAKSLPESDGYASSGVVSVDIVGASTLISADSNGKSDPFVRLFLNGGKKEVYKTKTKKRTLDPHWNESTSFDVSNRYYSLLTVAAYDWDFGSGQDDPLGSYDFPLSEVKPDGTPTEVDVELKDENGNSNGGVVHLVFRFKPKYIVPVKKNEKGLSDTALFEGGKTFIEGGGKVLGGGLGAGLGAVGKVKNTLFNHRKKD